MNGRWYRRLWPWLILSIALHLFVIWTVRRGGDTTDTGKAFYTVSLRYAPKPEPAATESDEETRTPEKEAPASVPPAVEKEKLHTVVEQEEAETVVREEKKEDVLLPAPAEQAGGTEEAVPSPDARPEDDPHMPGPEKTVKAMNQPAGERKDIRFQASATAPVIEGLRARLEAELIYPYVARKRGLQGVVFVTLQLDEKGYLTGIEVTKSSGHGVLDDAAVRLVGKVVPYPHGLGRSLSIDIPIRYSLLN